MSASSSSPTPTPSSYKNAPTRSVSVQGVNFAYPAARPGGRRTPDPAQPPVRGPGQLGSTGRRRTGRPTPRDHLRQPRRRRVRRLHTRHHRGDGPRHRAVHPGPRVRPGRPARPVDGRLHRPGHRGRGTRPRAPTHPRGHRARRRTRHRQGHVRHRPGHAEGDAAAQGPEALPLLHQTEGGQRAATKTGTYCTSSTRPLGCCSHPDANSDDDRAAGDVAGKSCPAGRVVKLLQNGEQAGQGLSLVRVSSQIAVEGRADVGAGDRHVNTSEKQGRAGGWVEGLAGQPGP